MEEVITNDYLLTKVLLRLPVKSVLRFKSVSKHWRSIITDARFDTLHNPDPDYVSGLLFNYPSCTGMIRWNEYTDNYNTSLNFISLGNYESLMDATSITHIQNLSGIKILNSCSGLLLCIGYNEAEDIGGYHVLNPTTKQFETLPDPNLDGLEGIALAYDPSVSPHFKVITLTSAEGPSSDTYQIEIYSSETKTWRASGERFTTNGFRIYLSRGVYWNGAMNWLNTVTELMYYNVEEERVGFMQMSLVPPDKVWYTEYYFGESGGYLHFVDYYFGPSPTTQFNVYEMRKDYSEWFVKYQVDLTAITFEFPEMTVVGENSSCPYSVASILRRKDYDEGSSMILFIPGKFLLYNFLDGTYKIIYEHEDPNNSPGRDNYILTAHPYIESLYPLLCCQNRSNTCPREKNRGRSAASYRSKRGGKVGF